MLFIKKHYIKKTKKTFIVLSDYKLTWVLVDCPLVAWYFLEHTAAAKHNTEKSTEQIQLSWCTQKESMSELDNYMCYWRITNDTIS